MRRIFKPAALAAALLLTTALAVQAGPIQRPGPTGAGGTLPMVDPVTTSSVPDVASPGDAFLPRAVPDPQPDQASALTCWVEYDENGVPTVYVSNGSGQDYPPGTNILIKFSDGQTMTFTFADSWFSDGKTIKQVMNGQSLPPECELVVRIASS